MLYILFTNSPNAWMLHIEYCGGVISSSSVCDYPSHLVSLHGYTFHGMFMVWQILTSLFEARRSVDRINNQRTSCTADDKCSLIQQIYVYTVLAFTERRIGPLCLA